MTKVVKPNFPYKPTYENEPHIEFAIPGYTPMDLFKKSKNLEQVNWGAEKKI